VQAPNFIHLHCHSEFSLIDGMVRIKPLMEQAKQAGFPAVALTDQSNLFAAVKFYKAAMAAGIKPIFGADLYLRNPSNPKRPFGITALCQNDAGYRNLIHLISEGYLHGQEMGQARIDFEILAQYKQGLIILSGAQDGDIGQAILAGNITEAKHQLTHYWLTHFKDHFYIELQRTNHANEDSYIASAIQLAEATKTPVVATNNVRFLSPDDFDAHEARVCIHDSNVLSDPNRPKRYTAEQHLRSPDEMQSLFQDIPEALSNSVEIAKRCNVHLQLGKSYLPDFPVPAGMTAESYLAQQSEEGLTHRLKKTGVSSDQHDAYLQRLQHELGVINQMGFPGYFLIVADFIQWSRDNDIPVGPGRGSGAGSLVAYVLGITDLDPLEHELLFERFLNPERVSMPDFDIDFCMDGRDQVIDYVAKKYGRQSVSQIITFGTMAAKAVVRDVGRVLGYSYGHIDKIAKLIPFEIGMTLDKALEVEDLLRDRYEQEDDTKLLIDLAKKLEGVARNAGKHAGGVVISPSKLTDFTAVYCEPDSQQLVSQFDKDDVEAVGLVKFDFLGLRTLTIIKWALQNINATQQTPISIEGIPMDDSKTFALLKECQTLAVFQLESRGMRDLIKRLQPDCFEEIVALVALFRPGPLQSGMVDDFIDRKHGRAKVEYPHPDLEAILKPTYGVILYQEQVMQIAQVLAGYTLGGADILRRAMGKKKAEEMAEQRAIFTKGAIEREVSAKTASSIFDLMEKFAGYGFNRSHSAAYALIAYQTAWLKAHYPAEFMAAVLSSDMDNTEKVVNMVNECKSLHLKMEMPNLNTSHYRFTVSKDGGLIYGLGAIKGAGEAAIEHITAERDANGPYSDLFSFCKRLDTHKANRRVIDALIKAGSMDYQGIHRACLIQSIDNAFNAAERNKRDKANNQGDLFAQLNDQSTQAPNYASAPVWRDEKRLRAEKEVLGFYISGHPIELYQAELNHITTSCISKLKPTNKQTIVVAGFISTLRAMNTKRGDRMAFVTLEDNTSSIELAVFAEPYLQYRDLLIKDQLIIVEGTVSVDDFSGGYRMSANQLFSMGQARELYAKGLLLDLQAEQISKEFIAQLERVLLPHCGGTCPVLIRYDNGEAKAKLRMGDQWRVNPSDDLLNELRTSIGDKSIQVGY
jgi:DNA polymerase-3 subunit alpha